MFAKVHSSIKMSDLCIPLFITPWILRKRLLHALKNCPSDFEVKQGQDLMDSDSEDEGDTEIESGLPDGALVLTEEEMYEHDVRNCRAQSQTLRLMGNATCRGRFTVKSAVDKKKLYVVAALYI